MLPATERVQRDERHRDEFRHRLAGKILGCDHVNVAGFLLELFQTATNQINRGKFGKDDFVLVAPILHPLTGEQPKRICTRLINKTEEHFRRNRHPRLIIIPSPRWQIQATGQFGTTMLPK